MTNGMFGLNVIDTNTANIGTKYSSATTRRALLALMLLCFGEELGIVTMVAAFERGQQDIERKDCTMHKLSEPFHSRSLLVDLLVGELGDGSCGCVLLVRAQDQDHPKMQKVDDFNMKYRHAGRQTSGCGATKCLETCVREASKKVVLAEHTPTTSEWKSCLQCGQEGAYR